MKTLKLLIFGSLCCLGMIGVCASAEQPDTPAQSSTKVLSEYASAELVNSSAQFDEVVEGSKVSQDLVVKNRGTIPLEITKMEFTSPNISATYEPKIPPGGEGKVTLTVNTQGMAGSFEKRGYLYTNDPITPRLPLYISGKVKEQIQVTPGAVVFERSPSIVNLDEKTLDLLAVASPFAIIGVESDLDKYIEYKTEVVEQDKHYKLKVRNKAPEGNYQGKIRVRTNNPNKPELLIDVRATILDKILVMPKVVKVGKGGTAEAPSKTAEVLVRNLDNQPFAITNLSFDKKLIAVRQEPIKDGIGHTLTIAPVEEKVAATESPPHEITTTTAVEFQTDVTPGRTYKVLVSLVKAGQAEK